MDLGSGIAIASLTIFIFLICKKIKIFSDLKNVKTFGKAAVFISANIAHFLKIPAIVWYYDFRLGRGDYPWFADAVAIPIMEETFANLVLFVLLNIFLILTTIKTNLPTQLWVKAKKYSKPIILWELLFGFLLLYNFNEVVRTVRVGDHLAIPITLFFTYIILTLRAGQISKY